MKKSGYIKLVLVSGLLGSANAAANASTPPATNRYSNPGYLRTGFAQVQDTVETRPATHGFVFMPRGGFGFFGHHAHVAG